MKQRGAENRREPRYPLHAAAIIERASGEKLPGSTINLSGGGALLRLEADARLQLGEIVNCGVNLYDQKPPQSWGVGRVVRAEKSLVAIDFTNLKPPDES